MDVLALEHNFGKEIETSIQQLFSYFCNNLNLGQWQTAKACLRQLNTYKKNFQFDLDSLLVDIIQSPQLYVHHTQTIQSSFHLALLLYEFATQAQLISDQNDLFYDKILFKFIIYSIVNTETDLNTIRLAIEELANFMQANYSSELSSNGFECLKNLTIAYPSKIEHVFKLVFKYNPSSEHIFLKVNLAAVNKCVDNLSSSTMDTLCDLLNLLLVYEFRIGDDLELENKKYESIALIQRSFKEICTKFNQLWSNEPGKLEENYRRVYVSLLDEESEHKTDLLNLFCKTNYQIERVQLITSTFNDDSLPILSMIKKYSNGPYLWHRLFLFCYYEKKILLKCLIDECLLLISRNQCDNLLLVLSLKELQNMRPLILLMGISRVQDLQAAKKLISCLCLNAEKGSLIDKIGNLLKTHLDFIAWFMSIKRENRKRDITFNELIRLLHKKLPLNLVAHYIDVNTLDYGQMIKILRNTLTDTETDEKPKWVRFVDEVNEKISLLQQNCLAIYDGFYCMSEMLNSILFCCESFNYKLAQIANDINASNLATSEEMKRFKRSSTSTYLSFKTIQQGQDNKSNKSLVSMYDVENEYKKNVIDKFEVVRGIVSKMTPMNYRLELLENIYSLIYLSLNDFKDTEDESDDDQDELKINNNNNNVGLDPLSNGEMNESKVEQNDLGSQIEIVYSHEDSEFSIYGSSHRTNSKEDTGNLSSKSYKKQDSVCSQASSSQSKNQYASLFYYETDNETKGKKKRFINIDRRHAGGGGSFLCNDFLCRDILMLVKDLLQPFKSLNKSDTQTEIQSLNCSVTTHQELMKRSSKLIYLINETLWRLQLIKCESFQIEYGRINPILHDTSSQQAINESQEALVYDLMKSRKRAASSLSSLNSKTTKSTRSRVNTLNNNGTTSKETENNRRSLESHRSLSLITPVNQNKNSNQTIMKLLASIETLSALCLKESKLSEANQLVKMYASNKEACDSFEFRQIIFNSIYSKVLDDLHDLDEKKTVSKSLIEQSLTSLDLVKLTENILLFEKENNLLQCLFLCDVLSTTKLSLKLSCDLADFAQIKLNLVQDLSENKTDADMKTKLNLFLVGVKTIASHLLQQQQQQQQDVVLKESLNDYLFQFDGIYLDLNESPARQTVETSIRKYDTFNQLGTTLDALKSKFESQASLDDQNTTQLKQTDIYQSIMNTINDMISILKSQDLISTYLYDPNQFNKQVNIVNETEMNTIEKLIYKTVNSSDYKSSKTRSSNYLLSFYEYCKTLFNYFKENNALTIGSFNSCFSILNSSPASLICKLLFEDLIKPNLIESLTKKLNLNLTAIILHNSCPRLKLNMSNSKRTAGAKKLDSIDYLLNTENNFYSLNSFYTILNENDLSYCSKKKPDVFLRDLLFKLLKYCKNYTNKRVIDLATAKEIYENAEFKSILNESQELQHLNLLFLKTDCQKLSFFINLHNLLCIHAHFYLASFVKLDDTNPDSLFNNKTEKLLFQQRMSYKVGQMGCVSLYDLRHLVLMRSFFNKFNQPANNLVTKNKKTNQVTSQQSSPCSKSTLSEQIDLNSDNNEPLYKYSYFKLDLDAEPLWMKSYLPSETACDYRILFALTNCAESDPPICVYDSDSMLSDQLQMQMSLFLTDSVFADLCQDVLYLPSFLVDNYALFIKSDNASRKTDLENFVRFLIDNVQGELRDHLKGLLELEPEGFGGENIDEFGRRELSFPIERVAKSSKFSLVIDSDSTHKSSNWYKTQINKLLKQNDEERLKKLASRTKLSRSISQTSDLPGDLHENAEIRMENLDENVQAKQKLNQDCLDYIGKTSPLISQSLSFLFSNTKREEFFKHLNETFCEHSLNRFIQLYVPLDYVSHLSMQTKLNLITQFLLTNKTEESKIELIIDLANHYAMKQEWNLVSNLLNNCTQDNEELIDSSTDSRLNRKSSISRSYTHLTNNELDLDTLDAMKESEKLTNDINQNNNGRYSRKDLYNLYDHACICQAYQEAKSNEKSYVHLFKIKNFIKQIRAVFGLMHLWSVESCVELVDYCLAKAKFCQEPTSIDVVDQVILMDQMFSDFDVTDNLMQALTEKKNELAAYRELTKYARTTLQKYYEHQQMQDAAGYYENKSDSVDDSNLAKIKKCCQKCLTWQFAKAQLESSSSTDDETNELIMDLFLMNDHFTSAKYLIKKHHLSDKLKFKLDFGHLKYRLLNLNVSSSIIVIDLDAILAECVSFRDDFKQNDYMFEICFKLLNELKDLRELNNQVLISLSEYLFENYRRLLNEQQTKELKTIQLTAKIFQILVQELDDEFDSYKRHHSSPLLIIEQLLMNSHIDLCSKAIRVCRDNLYSDSQLAESINSLLVQYATKALEFKVFKPKKESSSSDLKELNKFSKTPQGIKINKKATSSVAIIPLSTSSPNYSILSQSVRNSSLSSSFSSNSHLSSNPIKSSFVMPDQPPPKEEWVRDEDVNECMVCNTRRFTLLTRRHHCRRCGRVVCSDCAKNMTLIDNVPSRTCDDCFRQMEKQKENEKRLLDIELSEKNLVFSKKLIRTSINRTSLLSRQKRDSVCDDLPAIEENVYTVWQLMGGNENETSRRRDEEIRSSFKYQQAPSTSLCLSILDLHDQPLECVKNLLNMCDNLSSYLQTANYQVEDFALIINMIKHLLHNAKVKLLQNSSSNMISLCDTFLSLIDVLEQLLLDNCSNIPSLYELKNTETVRRFRNRLLEEERHELAMNISTKCGLDSQTVWASWGLTELRCGNYKEARNKFEKCMKPIQDKQASISSAQLKILADTVSYLENTPPVRKLTTQTLGPLLNVRSLIAEPQLAPNSNNSNLDDIHFNECIFYLDTYGNYAMVASFYQKHGYIEKAFQYIYENKCSPDTFVESLLVPSLRTGDFYHLIDHMLSLERIQHKLTPYYGSIGKYLEKNTFLNTLYDFQILMKDYVRACMSCLCFFTRHCQNYADLFNNINYLSKARKHLEQYLEISSLKQFGANTQLNSKQNSLCKQITPQEVDNYLNAINLQIEVTKFINNCSKKDQILNQKATCTVFGTNDTKIQLCCSILLSGDSIQEGFGFVIRIIQCFKLNPTLVYSQIARELAKQYNFKEIHNLLKCINESGYEDQINSCYDECISTCIRVLSAENNARTVNATNLTPQAQLQLEQQQQQYSKEVEELIKLMKDDDNRINAFILNGRLKSAYLIAIKKERADIVKHIANAAERAGQNLIKDICMKWLEKKQSQQ